ncbi:unnamed protein product [Chilo suppressalis]|uniref:Uncharacterized protein n=1 Tax=Chilo suppressalis TaxID=168631 RepID=A0ABN8BDU5_CHISP|nr:unnamed protein product [Chilo suppressalis]
MYDRVVKSKHKQRYSQRNMEQTIRSKADTLAKRMGEVVDSYAEVGRPEKTEELRVTGLNESVTPEEVVEAVAKKGDCSTNEGTAKGMHPGQGDTD